MPACLTGAGVAAAFENDKLHIHDIAIQNNLRICTQDIVTNHTIAKFL